MSVKIANAVWESDVTDGRLVLLALADNANDAGWCYPGAAYLSGKCQIHRATVFRQLEKLEGQNLILRRERRRTNGSRRTNRYRINLPLLQARKRVVSKEEEAELDDFDADFADHFDASDDVLV